jgi:hypothetical protein
MLEDDEFRRGATPRIISPVLQSNGFQDVDSTLLPTRLPGLRDLTEDPSVPLFPNLPEDEAWEELPNPIKEGGLERMISPFCNGGDNAFSLSIRCAHDDGHLIPELRCVRARVQKVIYSLFCAFT